MALQKAIVPIEIAQGLDTKTDTKLVPAGKALVLENARFQKTGRLSKRFGLVLTSNSSDFGNIDTLKPYAVASDNSSLYCFTKDQVLAYKKGTGNFLGMNFVPLSPSVDSRVVIKTAYNEICQDMDYNPTVGIRAFCSTSLSRVGNKQINICVEDENTKTTRRTFINLASLGQASQRFAKIRVIGTPSNPSIMVAYKSGTFLTVDTYNSQLIQVNSVTYTVQNNTNLDACRDSLFKIVYIQDNGTSSTITLRAFDATGVPVNNASYPLINRIGLTSLAGPLSVSCYLAGGFIHVAYPDTSNEICLTGFNATTFANSITFTSFLGLFAKNLAICADESNVYVTAGFNSSMGKEAVNNEYLYYKFSFLSNYSFISGKQLNRLSPAARPFLYDSRVYGIAKCSEETTVGSAIISNRTQVLVDLEEGLISMFFCEAAGLRENLYTEAVPYRTTVPNSVVVNDVVHVAYPKLTGVQTGDFISTEFTSFISTVLSELDFKGASRSKAKVGENLFICNGQVQEIDGERVFENGFIFPPYILKLNPITTAPDPDYNSKTINYICTYEYYDGNGNVIESAPSPVSTIVTPSSCNGVRVECASPVGSLKNIGQGSMALVVYRTEPSGTVFYRSITYPILFNNGFVDTYGESISNANLINNRILYTAGGVLENNPAPAAKFSTSGGNRLFLGGLEDGDIAYSKKQLQGESVNFNSLLRIRISSGENADTTKLTALGYLDGKLIIFREQSIYFIQGDGPLETGQQDTFTEPEVISSDAGCVDPRSVLNVPMGIMFKSRKGIYLLNRSLSTEYIGAAVEDFNNENIVAAIVSDKFNEARFYTSSNNCLVYNYLFNTWSVFKGQTNVDADIWQGSPVSLVSNKVVVETENTYQDDGQYYSMKLVTPWLKLNAIQGFQRVYQLWIIGGYKSVHTLKMKIYVNYIDTVVETYDLVYNASEEGQYQFTVSMPVQKVESIKFELYDDAQSGTGESFDLTNLQAEVGLKSGGYKLAPSKTF